MQQEPTACSHRPSRSRFEGPRLMTVGAVLICATAAAGVASLVALCVHEIIRNPLLFRRSLLGRPLNGQLFSKSEQRRSQDHARRNDAE
jgi:hypothetical protein